MDIGITPAAIAITLITPLLGIYTPLQSYIGITGNPNTSDSLWKRSEDIKTTKKQINLQEPFGVFGVQYDVNKNVRLFAEHQSSVKEKNDKLGFNHAGVKLLLPVEKHSNLYAGLSVHSLYWDKHRTKMNNPIVILGGETGGRDVKVFGEYITAADDFENGRFGMGIKVIFQ
jgi:hypothetical protein